MSDIRLRCDITHEEQAEFLQIMGTKKKSYQELLGHFVRTIISVNKTFKECETKNQLKLNFPDSKELITFTIPNDKTEEMRKELLVIYAKCSGKGNVYINLGAPYPNVGDYLNNKIILVRYGSDEYLVYGSDLVEIARPSFSNPEEGASFAWLSKLDEISYIAKKI